MKFEIQFKCGLLNDDYKAVIECDSFEELKEQILKRFGNYKGTRKAEKERAYAKGLIRHANNIEELERNLQQLEYFKITVKPIS